MESVNNPLEELEKMRRQSSLQLYRQPTSQQQEAEQKVANIIPKVPPATEHAKITLPDGRESLLPILQPTEGAPMLDIQKLYNDTGMFTYDPGFTCTGSCASTITYIDGDKGELRYRGYDIAQLAENCTYMEVCYLLIYGELPSAKELIRFEDLVISEMVIHQKLQDFYRGFNYDAHPMAIMCGVVGALSAFYHGDINIKDPRQRENIAIKLVAKMPTIAAYAFRTSIGLPLVQPKKKYSFMHNFFYMMFSNPMEDEFNVDPRILKAMEVIFITHADHEQNASTSTVRIAGSSFANPFACISAGIVSLWGPAHGGANEAVLNMLEAIGSPEKVPEHLAKCKDKNSGVRLMGFGHRVYKNYDPRAKIMAEKCNDVLAAVRQKDNKLLKLAKELEQAALNDQYFVSRKLYPNVDFYTGIMYTALDIPTRMFTCLFAVARTVGWICHWNEMMAEELNKIGRPRQLYVGEKLREFMPINEREDEAETRVCEMKKIVKMTNLLKL